MSGEHIKVEQSDKSLIVAETRPRLPAPFRGAKDRRVAIATLRQPANTSSLWFTMLNAEHFIVTFARAVELFRTRPDSVDEQKTVLRELLGVCQLGPATLAVEHGEITALGKSVAMSLPGLSSLADQLRDHAVTEISVDQGPAPAQLLNVLRQLASAPVGVAWSAGNTVRVTFLSHQPSPVAPDPVATAAKETLEDALRRLERAPYDDKVLTKVSAVAGLIPMALRQNLLNQAVHAMDKVIALEAESPDGAPSRAYSIAIRKMLSPSALAGAADATLLDGHSAAAAMRVLVRAGSAGVSVVVERMESAHDARHIRAYLAVLGRFEDHADALVRLLEHPEAMVVEGVTKLLAARGLHAAVPALVRRLEDGDPHLLAVAAKALAQLGTASATGELRKALSSSDGDVQIGVVRAIGGRTSGALAMPLVSLAEESVKPGTLQECYRALGRIGTPAALQALIQAAEPGGRFVGRESTERRLAAIDGLKAANHSLATSALKKLVQDREKAVRTAAEVALTDLGAR